MLTWLKQLCSGNPHFIIGGADAPYMLRWYLIPRNRVLNIYLHKFLRDGDDRALHDHPWWFVSLMLKGGYVEVVPHPTVVGGNTTIKRQAGSLAFRRATHRHRVVLLAPTGVKEPCWTLVVTGRKARTLGLLLPQRIRAVAPVCSRGRQRQCRPWMRRDVVATASHATRY